MIMKLAPLTGLVASLCLAAACSNPSEPAPQSNEGAETAKTLTLYSSRHYDSDKALYAQFEEQAGVTLEVREAGADQLLETMKAEGDQSPADIILTSDAGSLWRFQDAGLTQTITSEAIEGLVPANYRQADGHWFGVARRMRGIAYDPARLSAADLATWGDLAEEDKRGEICVRSSSNIYNLSLMGELIDRLGSEAAGSWASAIVTNMARNPQGGDTDQIRAIAAGECSIAIVNHYYWVRLATSEKEADQQAASATTFTLPEFAPGSGSHINITGAAVAATADDVSLATQFIEFLLTEEGQRALTTETKELPIVDGAAMPEGVSVLPDFMPSDTNLEVYGQNQAEAQRLFDLAGWN